MTYDSFNEAVKGELLKVVEYFQKNAETTTMRPVLIESHQEMMDSEYKPNSTANTWQITFYIPPASRVIWLFGEPIEIPFPHLYLTISLGSGLINVNEISYTLRPETFHSTHQNFLGSFLPNASGRSLCFGSIFNNDPIHWSSMADLILNFITEYYQTNYNNDWWKNAVRSNAFKLIVLHLGSDIFFRSTEIRVLYKNLVDSCKQSDLWNSVATISYADANLNPDIFKDYMELMKELSHNLDFWDELAKEKTPVTVCFDTYKTYRAYNQFGKYEYDINTLTEKTRDRFEIKKDVSV